MSKDERVVFWSKVERRGAHECWPWLGSINEQGYGQVSINRITWRAHRLAVRLDGRKIPPAMVVDHICRNRSCVNPGHLRVVTPKENTLENSEHWSAKYAARDHCSKGHKYTPETSFVKQRGHRSYRVCRICQRGYTRRWRERQALSGNPSHEG